jgi:ABC-type multidrug transport system permease subunit
VAFASDILFGALNLAVFLFVSRTFGDVAPARLGGAPSYFAFVAVGISITAVIQGTSVGLARRVREEQLTGTLEALVAQPVSATELSLGLAGFPFLFGMVRAAVYLAIAAPFMELDSAVASWMGVGVMFLAITGAVASIGVALGAMVLVSKRSEALVGMVSFVLGTLGGALFPVSVLPGVLESVASVMPTKPAFDGVRSALFHGGGWGDDALALVAFTLVALPLGVALFHAALAFTRRRGSLSQY